MTESKKRRLRERQIELLKNFEGDHYQEKKVGNEWWIKSWNGGTGRWQVAIFTETSYKKYKSFELKKYDGEEIKPDVPFNRPTLESIKESLKK